MKKIEAIIFDMDGTLYSFDKKNESHFLSSTFGQQIHDNCVRFFQARFELPIEEAKKCYSDFNALYSGEVSLGLERDLGIPRSEYFSATWDLQPSDFMMVNQELIQMLSTLSVKMGILSAAPTVWVNRVLQFLSIKQFFLDSIFTGEPDIRKPDPQAFMQLADLWNLRPDQIVSIGDQEVSDILPAKQLGMTTVRICQDAQTQADFVAQNAIQAIALLKQKGVL